MRNETSQSWYFMPLSILLSSLAAKDIRDNLFLGLFIEGVECLPCAAVTGCPWWRGVHATPLWGNLPTSCQGRFACWDTFSKEREHRRTAPHSESRCEALLHYLISWTALLLLFSAARRILSSNRNCCNPQGKSEHTNRSASPAVAPRA